MMKVNNLAKSPGFRLLRTSLFHSPSLSETPLQESIKSAIQTKSYIQIPNLLISSPSPNPNPFSFLTSFSEPHKTQIIDEILQSLIHIRPRSLPQNTYSHLLSHILQNPNPFPLALAILQRTLRSGCLPAKHTHLSLSSAWLDSRRRDSVMDLLSGMRSIGYRPDTGTCNYLLSSLCEAEQFDESVLVLKDMGRVGCEPDSDSYGNLIGSLCGFRRTEEAFEFVKQMVQVETRVVLTEGTVMKLVRAMKVNGELERAVEMVRLLEKAGIRLGVGGYEEVVKGCLERKEFVLAGKLVAEMVEKGFIPRIKVRQRVLEGLYSVQKGGFANVIRQKFAKV